ncbi:hypothetical protein HUJ04_009584 [Dendroctonus ponderosae]|nr:hypothetical protein HUJ04_009584 [Dendroctonus ponderosae]
MVPPNPALGKRSSKGGRSTWPPPSDNPPSRKSAEGWIWGAHPPPNGIQMNDPACLLKVRAKGLGNVPEAHIGVRGYDQLPAFVVADALQTAVALQQVNPLHAKTCLKAARWVVDAAMHHPAVVAALVAAQAPTFFQHLDVQVVEVQLQLPANSSANYSSAYDCQVAVG